MASTDARPIPLKNTAYRVTFPILDADGDLVTGASGLDSEVSLDGGTFTDCTNEATEIASGSGMYYLDLTSAEMNADTVAIIVKTSTSGAKTTPIVLYPAEDGDLRADVRLWLGSAPNALSSGRVDSSVGAMAAGVVTATAVATNAIDADAVAADAVAEIQSGLATAAALTTLAADVTAILDDTGTAGVLISSAGADALLDRSNGVETGYTLRQALRLLVASLAGKLSGAATTTITIRNLGDGKDRIVATVDADGNRTALTYDLT